jgi:glycosyltransferase involved in cell wall biosynthesis
MSKRPHSVGYFSAYYRGLECLLVLWPRIRQLVPDATLDVYYGWNSWVKMEGENGRALYDRITTLLADLKDQGVTEHGRVSHEKLAIAMKATQVWAYPTEFAEIHCITALKAQAAGCWPVVTNVAALKETVMDGDKINCGNIYTNEYGQDQFIKAVVAALTEGKTARLEGDWDWSTIATKWEKVMK